jgi:arginase
VIGNGSDELTGLTGPFHMIEPANVTIVELPGVDDIERLSVRGGGVHAFTMRDIDERGMTAVMQQAIHVASSGTADFQVSFDMDAVDPSEAPGVGTPVPGGITLVGSVDLSDSRGRHLSAFGPGPEILR